MPFSTRSFPKTASVWRIENEGFDGTHGFYLTSEGKETTVEYRVEAILSDTDGRLTGVASKINSNARSKRFSTNSRACSRGNVVESRRLGSAGPAVSELGLGCMGMSEFYGPAEESESILTIHRALDAGVTLLDTADIYGSGANETLWERRSPGAATASCLRRSSASCAMPPIRRSEA